VLRLAVATLLVATVGQWLQGGHYAVAPLTWLLLGWASRPLMQRAQTAWREPGPAQG
jgi:hypothetical protein